MKKSTRGGLLAGILALSVAGCVDSKYDLSDIDTTVRVPVNDLAVAVNIDDIELRSIIDTDENIQIVDNAYYAYVKTGSFNSSSISVKPIRLSIGDIDMVHASIRIPGGGIPVGGSFPEITADVPSSMAGFDINTANVPEDIVDLTRVGGNIDITLNLASTGFESLNCNARLKDLELQLPAGLDMTTTDGVYDATTGVMTLHDVDAIRYTVELKASAIDIPAGVFDYTTHTVSYKGTVGIKGGKISVSEASGILPEEVSLNLGIKIGDIDVATVDGKLQYEIDNVSIPDIEINNLPDILAQKGTNLLLANPQLYFNVTNPLYSVGLYAQTGFEITSYHGSESRTYAIDEPYFTIGANAVNEFCLSPRRPDVFDSGYANSTYVGYSALSNVLSGDGLPDKLRVAMNNPRVPVQTVTGFMLGKDYGAVEGNYKFLAPLQFDGGSQIYYSDRVDGWADDELDKITIEQVRVMLDITTDVPMGIEFTGYPIDKSGNRIPGVTISTVNIPANASNYALEITVSGDVKGLDGLEFVAKASAADNGAPLSPGMHIKLANIRPRVTGYYQDEL